MVAWEDTTAAFDNFVPPPRIVGGVVTKDDAVAQAFFIATQPVSKRHIALGTNGTRLFVAWQTPKNSPADIRAKVLDTSGNIVAGGAPEVDGISVASGTADESNPAVVWDRGSSAFVIAWQTSGGVVMQRFTPNGSAIDAMPQFAGEVSDHAQRPALASFNTVIAIAYSRVAGEPQYGGGERIFVRLAGGRPRVRAVR